MEGSKKEGKKKLKGDRIIQLTLTLSLWVQDTALVNRGESPRQTVAHPADASRVR